mmetsp:Transcript_8201/g.11834  ORF Transcript_8201/g.11834 Transcript_8201/m.11834 type:complete len:823 (-) Transcript_8201:326-2794(-)
MPHPSGTPHFSLDHIPTTDAEVDAAAALMSLPTFGSNRHNQSNRNPKSSSTAQRQHQQRGHSSSTAATSTTAATPRYAFADNTAVAPSSATHIRNVCYSSDSSLSDLSYGVEPPARNRSRSPPSTLEQGAAASGASVGSDGSKSRGRKSRKSPQHRHKQRNQPRFAFDDDQPRGQQMPNVRVTSYASDSSLSSYGEYDERVAHRRSNARREPPHTTNDGRVATFNKQPQYHEAIEVELNPDSHQSSYGNQHNHHHHPAAATRAGHIVTPVATSVNATNNGPRFEFSGDSTQQQHRQKQQHQHQGQYRNPTTYNSDSSISSYGHGGGSAAGSVASGAAAYINPSNVSIPNYNNNNATVNNYLATDARMLANMKLDPSYNMSGGATTTITAQVPSAPPTSPRFAFADDQHQKQQQQQKHQHHPGTIQRSNSACDSSISSNGDDSSAAYSYGENLVAQAAANKNAQPPPSPGIPWYPGSVSLALPGDEDILSPLHCFMRRYGVEAFSAEPNDVARPRYGKAHASRVVVGQVGIRCLHCKHRPVSERPERAVCYPSSLRNIYHSIETWQRKHSPVCTDMPRTMKDQLDGLIHGSRKSAGGRRQYWEESAQKLGMVDTPAGVRFAREPGLVESTGGAVPRTPASAEGGGSSSMSDLNASQSSIPQTISIPLVSPTSDDATLVSGFLFFLMSQMETCRFSEEDRAGNRSKVKDCPIGFPGMQCKHCRGRAGLGRYFPSSIDAIALANSDRNICNHVMKCRKCPDETKQELQRLQQDQANGKYKQKRGGRKQFFTRIWDRIHNHHPHPIDDGSPSCIHPIGSSGIRAHV